MREIYLLQNVPHSLLPMPTNLFGGKDVGAYSFSFAVASISRKIESLLFSKKIIYIYVNHLPVGVACFGCDDAPPPPSTKNKNLDEWCSRRLAKDALPVLKWARSNSYIMEMNRRAHISSCQWTRREREEKRPKPMANGKNAMYVRDLLRWMEWLCQ